MNGARTERRNGQTRTEAAALSDALAEQMASGIQLSADSSIPLYHQLALVLQRQVRDLGLHAGDRFPAEESIAHAFSVSRPTANRAIQELIDREWLSRKRGRGTYVQRSSPAQLALLNRHLSFAEEMAEHADYASRIIVQECLEASPADAEALEIEPDAPIIRIRRLHTIGGRPVMVCDSILVADRFPGLEKRALTSGSLYKTLSEVYDCTITRAERCVEVAELFDGAIAELLALPLFAPILLLSGLAFGGNGKPVEHMSAHVREGVSFRTVIGSDHCTTPARDLPCPKGTVARGEAC